MDDDESTNKSEFQYAKGGGLGDNDSSNIKQEEEDDDEDEEYGLREVGDARGRWLSYSYGFGSSGFNQAPIGWFSHNCREGRERQSCSTTDGGEEKPRNKEQGVVLVVVLVLNHGKGKGKKHKVGDSCCRRSRSLFWTTVLAYTRVIGDAQQSFGSSLSLEANFLSLEANLEHVG